MTGIEGIDHNQSFQIPSPSKDPDHRYLRRGDLVRVSEAGIEKSKRLKDREGNLGRILKCVAIDDSGSAESFQYDVEWVLGGRLNGCDREDLVYRTADGEGMTDTADVRRRKRKPVDFMQDVAKLEEAKKKLREQQQEKRQKRQSNLFPIENKVTKNSDKQSTIPSSNLTDTKSCGKKSKQICTHNKKGVKRSIITSDSKSTTLKNKRKKEKSLEPEVEDDQNVSSSGTSLDVFERHSREFNRIYTRLKEKVDPYRLFWSDEMICPLEFDEIYEVEETPVSTEDVENNRVELSTSNNTQIMPAIDGSVSPQNDPTPKRQSTQTNNVPIFPSHPPYNWEMVERRMSRGRYIIDREHEEEVERFKLFESYYMTLPSDLRPKQKYVENAQCVNPQKHVEGPTTSNRVAVLYGVNWELFRNDIMGMCDAAILRADVDEDNGQRGSLSYTVKRIKENIDQACERTGIRQASELSIADDRHKFSLAVESYENKEAAMQSWRTEPFPERRYERVCVDSVCSGLSKVDEGIATFELRTNLPDSFIGQSYHYVDAKLSELWMKSVVDETTQNDGKRAVNARSVASALAVDEGVTRAQVSSTIQSLLIAVQDRVMTENNVLQQSELSSSNWVVGKNTDSVVPKTELENVRSSSTENVSDITFSNQSQNISDESPDIVEKPVWGIDCYTRRNICVCLELELDQRIALEFIEKWLLPAINACPENLAHNIGIAARILEGLPFDHDINNESDQELVNSTDVPTMEEWSRNLVAAALLRKLESCSPPWLKGAANQLRRARDALGPNFFRVHPKGHGSVLLKPKIKSNSLVTFYHGELYPSWRWGEKMDAIEITQQRKDLKPALPDFYNMALERPQKDPRGYALLFVDASRKAGHGSSLSHSCQPSCEVRVAAVNGELCLAMTTLREIEAGEELTFDYNAVTESLTEYRSAVCLCGNGKCRGSFLHFATADCYQQILTRNSPVASRFASLVRGTTKQVMSTEDEEVLRRHGFQTAAFGAISVNRREKDGTRNSLVDTMNIVPLWLRTYVAATLRYIEYERRALPIALLCDNLSANEKENTDISLEMDSTQVKVPKLEPSFFYFSRTQTSLINSLLEKSGFPSSLVGLQRKHAMQRVAGDFWKELDNEKKKYWKEQAIEDFESKMKAHQKASKVQNKKNIINNASKAKAKQHAKIAGDLVHPSKVSLQDADAEGISAMEQRIQQLTQTLSRIGRVLDRHREQSLLRLPLSDEESKDIYESMRNRVHNPLMILPIVDVVGWMWNSSNGVVSSLFRGVQNSKCARPILVEKLLAVKMEYKILDSCPVPDNRKTKDVQTDLPEIPDVRQQLCNALLEMRRVILDELKEMALEFKRYRARKSQSSPSVDKAIRASSPSFEDLDRLDTIPKSDGFTCESSHTDLVSVSSVDRRTDTEKASEAENSTIWNVDCESTIHDDKSVTSAICSEKADTVVGELGPWVLSYHERFTLEASADLLLMYASTEHFFVLQPYESLQSTPVEVYARELGNSVPQSVIDADLKTEPHSTCDSNENEMKLKEESQNDKVQASKGEKNTKSRERYSKCQTGKISKDNLTCKPDEIVSKVTVKYQGDYVLSQLLQWYNAGIGQKPGIPDMLGCTILPVMEGCFRSELLASKKSSAGKKTLYEYKIRPRLVEWYRCQHERGNPWPNEIRRAFELPGESNEWRKDTSDLFLPFGSPVIDFLVTGKDDSLVSLFRGLDAEAHVKEKANSDGLLISVDKGRPAQAVSTWVQCEACDKWRKIPWHVDKDLFTSSFFCKDNKWSSETNNCDAPEEDWDDADALVGEDGKVEGSPIKKDETSILEEKSFTAGAKFDVQRAGKEKFTIGTVIKTDFSGREKRIMFRLSKCYDLDEWIPFGSERIAPLHSRVPFQTLKNGTKECEGKDKYSVDDESNFTIGARFDVRRSDKDHYTTAFVTHTDLSGDLKRVRFHFSKSSTCRDEWVEFGSDRIRPFNSSSGIQNNANGKNASNKDHSQVVKVKVKTQTKEKTQRKQVIMLKKTKKSKVLNATRATSGDEIVTACVELLDEACFTIGARFDVFRKSKQHFYTAVVKETDFGGSPKKVLFHFPKMHVKFDEWIEVGSPYIRSIQANSSMSLSKDEIIRNGGKSPKDEPEECDHLTGKANKEGNRSYGEDSSETVMKITSSETIQPTVSNDRIKLTISSSFDEKEQTPSEEFSSVPSNYRESHGYLNSTHIPEMSKEQIVPIKTLSDCTTDIYSQTQHLVPTLCGSSDVLEESSLESQKFVINPNDNHHGQKYYYDRNDNYTNGSVEPACATKQPHAFQSNEMTGNVTSFDSLHLLATASDLTSVGFKWST